MSGGLLIGFLCFRVACFPSSQCVQRGFAVLGFRASLTVFFAFEHIFLALCLCFVERGRNGKDVTLFVLGPSQLVGQCPAVLYIATGIWG